MTDRGFPDYAIGPWRLRDSGGLFRALGAVAAAEAFRDRREIRETVLPDFTWGLGSGSFAPDGEPAYETQPGRSPVPYLRVYRQDGGWLWRLTPDWKTPACDIMINNSYTSAQFHFPGGDPSPSMHAALWAEAGRLFSFSVLPRCGLVLHAAAMLWKGKAILLCAASGTGKTTHARLWQQREGVRVLNGDRALCAHTGGVWTAYGMPWCGTSGESLNESAPIGALVLLERGTENRAWRVSPSQGALPLLSRVFAPPWDASLTQCALETLDSIVHQVPVLRLACTPDVEAVGALRDALESLPADQADG